MGQLPLDPIKKSPSKISSIFEEILERAYYLKTSNGVANVVIELYIYINGFFSSNPP